MAGLFRLRNITNALLSVTDVARWFAPGLVACAAFALALAVGSPPSLSPAAARTATKPASRVTSPPTPAPPAASDVTPVVDVTVASPVAPPAPAAASDTPDPRLGSSPSSISTHSTVAARLAPPQDPRLAQVFAIFDGACAQCHQTGKITGAGPAGGLANILELATIAEEPHLVRRGEPDASRLYQVVLDRHLPLELGADVAAKWPGADDVARLRTWIEELPAAPVCDGPKITAGDVAKAIDAAVERAGEAAAQELRFVSLAHLANACASPALLDGYRQGVAKLLNSLSWGAQPMALTAIDDAKTLFAFKLSDIGWVDEHWSALARAEPKAFALDLSGQIKGPGANARPIRGDWLASTAAQPAFYAELLGLPPTLDDTSRLLGISRVNDPAGPHGLRAGLKTSTVTRGPRVIERHQVDTRRMWLAYDFADGLGEHDIFERPLGGVKGASDKAQFRADNVRLMFGLPNGFLAYGLFEPDGHRIDQLPQRLELSPSQTAGTTLTGQSCISCHAAGPKPFTDTMRAHVTSEKFSGTREVRDQSLAIYETVNEWTRILDEDSYRFRRAQIQAGIDPDLTVDGFEPTSALAYRYGRAVDLATVAGEAALTLAALDARLSTLVLADRALVPRLREGLLTRTEANVVLGALQAKGGADPLAPVAASTTAGLKLALWTDAAVYRPGDLMTVYAQPSAPCHLTLISVNGAGKATVLFPSEFDPDNFVRPETPLTLPSAKAPYQFRLKELGAETLVAQCQTATKLQSGVEPDYERQRFTSLGSYENFLRTSYGLEGDPAKQRGSKLVKSTQGKESKDPKDGKDPMAQQTARSAVRIVVR